MLRLADSQAAFATAVFDPELPVPPDLRSLGEPASADRFAVYRNNVMVGLIEGLRDAYPVVCRLVGDEFFRAMAGIFARAHPPRSPVMLEYGDGFADFIAAFPPAGSVPYLADVARLERAWVEAYHAAEAKPLTYLSPATPFTLHPATRLVCSPFPILAIWQANQHDEPTPLELSTARDNVLVTRPGSEVQACRIPEKTADLVQTMAFRRSVDTNLNLDILCTMGALADYESCA